METIARGKSGMTKNAENLLDKAYSSAHAAVDSVAGAAEEAARTANDRVAAVAHEAVDKAAGAVAPAADWIADKGDSLSSAQKKLLKDTQAYVSAHPVKALGMALLAGFLISRIL